METKKYLKSKLPPVVAVVGFSNSGKTTFLEKLIADLKNKGFKIGTIKHDVHGFEMDKPGKDSWRHKKSGASTTIISNPWQIGMVKDVDYDTRPDELMAYMQDMDIVLAEGYKRSDLLKIEIFRSSIHKKPLCMDDKNLIAIICEKNPGMNIPVFSVNNIDKVSSFLINKFKLNI